MSDVLNDAEFARSRLRADRPSPAIPLLLLAAVVIGGIAMTFIQAGPTSFYFADPARLTYWVVASLAAYLVMILIARRQGHRRGIWVDRSPLALAGAAALLVAVVIVMSWLAPGDLLIRGNVPVLALAVGVLVWAMLENRPGLWILSTALVPLALLANLYNMENILYRMGVPSFAYAEQIANLGAVAVVLLVGAGAFAVAHRVATRRLRRIA
ncbi:hypothetical protein [Nakamurella lactea]|uniref:hypothetical protein n=1 Tax=Nakamurella lactea TaxID=459515 RepID=UPI0003FB0248|nr:hypothetical protein [Nakamurella lactea]